MSSERGARISRQDVTDLAEASLQLEKVAVTIKRANPVWADATVQLIIAVNDLIVRLQNKGAEAYARYLQKHGASGSPELAGDAAKGSHLAGERSMPQNEEED